MIVDIKGQMYSIDLMSVGLNLLGFIALIASWSDGIPALIVGVLIFLLDEIRHPYPVMMPVVEGGDDGEDGVDSA